MVEHKTKIGGVHVAPTEVLLRGATPLYAQSAWVDCDEVGVEVGVLNIPICTLPANHIVVDIDVWVSEAANSESADDMIQVGWDSDHDAYVTTLDVTTIGVKNPTLGADAKVVIAGARDVLIYYNYTAGAGLDDPTTGKVVVTVYYMVAPAIP
jgi:hypothetical protein